jgi:squalene-hopene/tetraprenyl-beta-curcumene cyclase
MNRIRPGLYTYPVAALLAAGLVFATGCRKSQDLGAVREKAEQSAKAATNWLKNQQNEDGTFGDMSNPQIAGVKIGFTSLAAIALMDQDLDENDPNVKRAVAFLAAQQAEDGSICMQPGTSNYETALTAVALSKTGNTAYDQALQKAQAFLLQLQGGAEGDMATTNPMFGGFGYGPKGFYDLSNTQFTLEALRATELGTDAQAFQNAIHFLENCQNNKAVNDADWVSGDGGFVYYPGGTRAEENPKPGEPLRSYGSMTYAGLLSFAYCNVEKDDPRVQAALEWLRVNYTVDENPGIGQDGLFYYYMVMAKALSAYGDKYLVTADGTRHNWAADLVQKLVELQHPDGYWVNSMSDRWLENNKALVTSYAMIVLDRCRPFLNE